jgi:hypothetical protein
MPVSGLVSAALLVSTLSSAPSFTVAVTRRVGIAPRAALDLAESLSEVLDHANGRPLGKRVSPRAFVVTLSAANNPDSAACQGAVDCVVALGKIGRVDWVVSLQLVKLGKRMAVDARIIDVARGATVTSMSATVPSKRSQSAIDTLASKLIGKLPAPAPQPPVALESTVQPSAPLASPPPPEGAAAGPEQAPPAPPMVSLNTEPDKDKQTNEVALSTRPTTPPLRYVAIGCGVLAVGAAGVGAWQGVEALNAANAANANPKTTAADLNAVHAKARFSDFSYGAAGVVAAVAIVLWLVSPSHTATPAAPDRGVGPTFTW